MWLAYVDSAFERGSNSRVSEFTSCIMFVAELIVLGFALPCNACARIRYVATRAFIIRGVAVMLD